VLAVPDPAELSARCPCGSAETYLACCGRFHDGSAVAATALLLMRSRYSAFAVGHTDYLYDTWDPTSRPARIELDSAVRWTRLEILETVRGGPFDVDGVVEFRAHYRAPGSHGARHERSWFARQDGRWVYVAGDTYAS
jgi:SEC-C motif domain protein